MRFLLAIENADSFERRTRSSAATALPPQHGAVPELCHFARLRLTLKWDDVEIFPFASIATLQFRVGNRESRQLMLLLKFRQQVLLTSASVTAHLEHGNCRQSQDGKVHERAATKSHKIPPYSAYEVRTNYFSARRAKSGRGVTSAFIDTEYSCPTTPFGVISKTT